MRGARPAYHVDEPTLDITGNPSSNGENSSGSHQLRSVPIAIPMLSGFRLTWTRNINNSLGFVCGGASQLLEARFGVGFTTKKHKQS